MFEQHREFTESDIHKAIKKERARCYELICRASFAYAQSDVFSKLAVAIHEGHSLEKFEAKLEEVA
jgi:hypothetical protein